jgi:hypothetical protein
MLCSLYAPVSVLLQFCHSLFVCLFVCFISGAIRFSRYGLEASSPLITSPSRNNPVHSLITSPSRNNPVHSLITSPSRNNPVHSLITSPSRNNPRCNVDTESINGGHNILIRPRYKQSLSQQPEKLHSLVFITTFQVGERTLAFGAALRKVGAEPFAGGAREFENAPMGKHCMIIYENTCDDWTTALFGAASQSVVVATSYATLGFDAMLESVSDTGSRVLLCNRSSVEEVSQCQVLVQILCLFIVTI